MTVADSSKATVDTRSAPIHHEERPGPLIDMPALSMRNLEVHDDFDSYNSNSDHEPSPGLEDEDANATEIVERHQIASTKATGQAESFEARQQTTVVNITDIAETANYGRLTAVVVGQQTVVADGDDQNLAISHAATDRTIWEGRIYTDSELVVQGFEQQCNIVDRVTSDSASLAMSTEHGLCNGPKVGTMQHS